MTITETDLRHYAAIGARARLEQLESERLRILESFPELASPIETRRQLAISHDRPRKTLSDDQRKAIGERMRKYWAGRRKQAAKSKG